MKMRLVFVVVAMVSLLTTCNSKVSDEVVLTQQENEEKTAEIPSLYRGVSYDEYSASDSDMQRLIDLLDAATNALLAVRQNGADRGYEAVVFFSTHKNGLFANTMVLEAPRQREQDEGREESEHGEHRETCKACGYLQGAACYKKIREKMKKENKEEIDIKIRIVDGDCVEIIY